MSTKDYVDYYFKEFVFGFMYNDIRRAIKSAKANFLVALGLSVYTEIMGGLVTGQLRDVGWSGRNFKAFLPYLGDAYVNLDKQIDLYKTVRCGLVHEYFIKKTHSMISVKFSDDSLPGIVYTDSLDHVHIAVEHYFRDFKAGVQKYYNVLNNGDINALRKFRHAVMWEKRAYQIRWEHCCLGVCKSEVNAKLISVDHTQFSLTFHSEEESSEVGFIHLPCNRR